MQPCRKTLALIWNSGVEPGVVGSVQQPSDRTTLQAPMQVGTTLPACRGH
jgi:arsenate reductase-like glutaredoxin family protein